MSMRYAFLIPLVFISACAFSTGDSETDYKVGELYENGKGVAQDMAQAATYYLKAAKAGSAKAQFTVGVLYYEGSGLKRDLEESVLWFRAAAMQGLAAAQHNLGNAYRAGEGVEQDFDLALEWYHKAAEQGYAPAAHNLGAMAGNGEGTPQNYAEAYKWLLLSDKLGTLADKTYKEQFRTGLTKETVSRIESEVTTMYENMKKDMSSSMPSIAPQTL